MCPRRRTRAWGPCARASTRPCMDHGGHPAGGVWGRHWDTTAHPRLWSAAVSSGSPNTIDRIDRDPVTPATRAHVHACARAMLSTVPVLRVSRTCTAQPRTCLRCAGRRGGSWPPRPQNCTSPRTVIDYLRFCSIAVPAHLRGRRPATVKSNRRSAMRTRQGEITARTAPTQRRAHVRRSE